MASAVGDGRRRRRRPRRRRPAEGSRRDDEPAAGRRKCCPKRRGTCWRLRPPSSPATRRHVGRRSCENAPLPPPRALGPARRRECQRLGTHGVVVERERERRPQRRRRRRQRHVRQSQQRDEHHVVEEDADAAAEAAANAPRRWPTKSRRRSTRLGRTLAPARWSVWSRRASRAPASTCEWGRRRPRVQNSRASESAGSFAMPPGSLSSECEEVADGGGRRTRRRLQPRTALLRRQVGGASPAAGELGSRGAAGVCVDDDGSVEQSFITFETNVFAAEAAEKTDTPVSSIVVRDACATRRRWRISRMASSSRCRCVAC